MYLKKLYIVSLVLIAFLFSACSDTKLSSLQVEYAETPMGIDVDKPRFCWQMVSDQHGQSQTAYQIVVTDEKQNEVWNTGRVDSDISLNIEYAGTPLKATTRYRWKLKVWNQDGKQLSAESWFETGLMNPTIAAWDGAKWIGGSDEDMVLHPFYLPVYNINYTIQLDKESKSTKAAFVYGANDPRLMNENLNLYNMKKGKDESYIGVELDISQMDSGKGAYLNVYRVGYAPHDQKDVPFKSLPVPNSVINNKNKYDKHTVYLKTMYGVTDFFIDGEDDANKIGAEVINPLGYSWDYICFPHLCEIGFSTAPNQTANFSDVEVRNYRVPNNVLFSEKLDNGITYNGVFSNDKNLTVKNNSYQVSGQDTEVFVVADIQKNSMPMLRTTFSVKASKVTKARLYITARGVYDAYINGQRIGDDYLNPGLTQYNKTHMYQTFDVTDYVQSGDNALGVMMGEGWWSGIAAYMGYFWNLFGDRQSLLSKLVITYADGTEEKVVSNPDTWSYFDNGPVIYSSLFQGEIYDAERESLVEGWSKASYNDSAWKRPVESTQENAIVHDPQIERNQMPAVNDFSNLELIGQYGQTIKKVKELTAISMKEVRPGVFVYDMGQNMAGVPHIVLSGEQPGSEIKLRYAEVEYPDLPEFEDNVGMIMLENIRGALAQDIYIAKGGNETIQPRFTFHGYRFIEITGIGKALPLQSVKGVVLSSIQELASSYETSNQKVNKLWENITWSTRGNFISIPTDCPQRNERMGWGGDISVFSRTATFMANLPQFFRRHMLSMRDTQREDGRFADISPIGGGFGGVLWGSAGITVAWESYLQYNDIAMLAEHYDAMKAYIDFLKGRIDPQTGLFLEGPLGDWLGPEQHKNDDSLLWEAYFIYDLGLMERIANVLNKKGDATAFKKMYDERKEFFNKTYFDSQTGKTIRSASGAPERKGEPVGTLVSYVLPLAFDICNPEIKEMATKNLLNYIENESKLGDKVYPPYSLMTGFIGTAWVNKALSDVGHSDAAYRVLQQTTYPSWLYSVEQGATTIWERLNSYTKEDGFGGNNSMNSFNHYSFGAIGAWMYNYSLGIERDENYPGFKHFILQPQPDVTGQMTSARGHYDSMYGRIESSWKIDGNSCDYCFLIPANTTATLYLPTSAVDKITEGGKAIDNSPYIEILGEENRKEVMKLQSGKYSFKVKE